MKNKEKKEKKKGLFQAVPFCMRHDLHVKKRGAHLPDHVEGADKGVDHVL